MWGFSGRETRRLEREVRLETEVPEVEGPLVGLEVEVSEDEEAVKVAVRLGERGVRGVREERVVEVGAVASTDILDLHISINVVS